MPAHPAALSLVVPHHLWMHHRDGAVKIPRDLTEYDLGAKLQSTTSVPPSPNGFPGLPFGPAMNPSRETPMST